MYTLKFSPAAYRLFKKLPQTVRENILDHIQVLKTTPHTGELLKGKHRTFYSLHLSLEGVAYRVIYQVFVGAETIIIRLADKRENIYKRLDEMKIQ
jgi:mRNA-degrading endonuclease RelE of RelBE toxin-antitoxin system